MNQSIKVIGVGKNIHLKDSASPQRITSSVVLDALKDASIDFNEIDELYFSNMMGDILCGVPSMIGQFWLTDVELYGTPVINVDNACAGGSSALALATASAKTEPKTVMVVGVEKMRGFESQYVQDSIEQGILKTQRLGLKEKVNSSVYSKSLTINMNADWAMEQITQRGTTVRQFASCALKAHKHASLSIGQTPLQLTVEDVLNSRVISPPLTRLMCSTFVDGAAAIVISSKSDFKGPIIMESLIEGSVYDLNYHQQLTKTATKFWNQVSLQPADIDVVELHDATSPEELFELECLGFFKPGEAGIATERGDTSLGGKKVAVNLSGGRVGGGHPLGATGLIQIIELVEQLRGTATNRQLNNPRFGVSVNIGGVINDSVACLTIHLLSAFR